MNWFSRLSEWLAGTANRPSNRKSGMSTSPIHCDSEHGVDCQKTTRFRESIANGKHGDRMVCELALSRPGWNSRSCDFDCHTLPSILAKFPVFSCFFDKHVFSAFESSNAPKSWFSKPDIMLVIAEFSFLFGGIKSKCLLRCKSILDQNDYTRCHLNWDIPVRVNDALSWLVERELEIFWRRHLLVFLFWASPLGSRFARVTVFRNDWTCDFIGFIQASRCTWI